MPTAGIPELQEHQLLLLGPIRTIAIVVIQGPQHIDLMRRSGIVDRVQQGSGHLFCIIPLKFNLYALTEIYRHVSLQ